MNAKQLKNSLLQLAIQGRLVEQRAEEGTAQTLIEQIQAEKEQLIKEKKIKKQKPLPAITEDEIPFEIPESWKWVRFGEIVFNKDSERKPLSSKERQKQKKNYDYYGASGIIDKVEDYIFEKPLLLIGEDGANLLTRSKPIAFIARGKYWVNNHAHVLDAINISMLKYISLHINAISLAKYVTGTAQPKMNQENMNKILIALPPLEEQKRIVAKIEELEPYIEKYGENYEMLESLNKKFPEDMQKSILQYAIQGRLVEQRAEEGTAQTLIEQIQAEKEKLIKEKKIKKQKPLAAITEGEIPFEIPESWEWVRLGLVGDWGAGATPSRSKSEYYGGDIPWLKTGDLTDGYVYKVSENISEEAVQKTSVKLNPIGSVLMAMYGATIGKLGILKIEATTNQACCACIPFRGVNNKYLFYYLLSERKNFISLGSGGAQPNISKEKIVNYIMPLPPLEEQKRIVAKIEELLPMYKQLSK